MNPAPDVEGLDESHRPPNDMPEAVSILGSYRPMRSPGLITLNADNLTQFFWRIALDINRALPDIQWQEEDLYVLSEWVVDKTFWHERFHHSMDILRHLFNVQTFSSLHEEALAVAYSRYQLAEEHPRYRHNRIKGPQAVIWDEFMKLAYQYTSAGYRDWTQYGDLTSLKPGICDYLAPTRSNWLKSVRIPVSDMVFQLLPVENGYEERVA